MDLFFTLLIFIIFGSIFIGIPYSIYRSIKRKKKALTVSLIIFSCIIIFCVWLVEAWEGGYMKQAKIESTKTNHSNVKNFIDASFTKCLTGSTSIILGTSSVACNSNLIANSFATYFNSVTKNSYSLPTAAFAVSESNTPALGVSHINYSDNTMTIITNIGDMNRGDVFLSDTVVREEYEN